MMIIKMLMLVHELPKKIQVLKEPQLAICEIEQKQSNHIKKVII